MPDAFSTLVELDRAAVLATVAIACRAGTEDLDRPSPCGDWTVRDLLAHLSGQQRGFAAAARGTGAALAEWTPVPAEDPVVHYLAASAEVLAAFAEPGIADRGFALPELRPSGDFAAHQAISFHLVDNAVHAWDLAASLGLDCELAPDLVQAALGVARQVPDGPSRSQPGSAFGPSHPVPDGASPLQAMLLLLGRRPDWSAR